MSRIVLGLVEEVTLFSAAGKPVKVVSRVDTGATVSSMDLNLALELGLGPITRSKTVRSASGVNKRPIIKVKIKINGEVMEEDFNLINRSHMAYKLLLGQNILIKGRFLIDPSKQVFVR